MTVPVIPARTAIWIQPLVGVLNRDFRNVGLDVVSYSPKQLPVGRLLGPFPPRVEDDPNAGVHRHVEVSIGDMGVDVRSVGGRFCFAEGAASRLGGGAGVPVVIVVAIQVHLVDVPAGVDVVSVRIKHDQDVKLGVLQHGDGVLISIVPSVDVPFR